MVERRVPRKEIYTSPTFAQLRGELQNKAATPLLDGFVRYMTPRLVGFARKRHCLDPEALVQEAYIRFFSAAHGLVDNKGKPEYYLYTILRNLIIDESRRTKVIYTDINEIAQMPRRITHDEGTDVQAIKNVEGGIPEILDRAGINLPNTRKALELRAYGFSRQEIADILDTTEGNIRGMLNRAREKIKGKGLTRKDIE